METAIRDRAGRREWAGLAVLALPTLLLSVDTSVLYLALPKLSADLGATSVQQLWITDSYGFLLAGFLVTMGTLGDRVGRRKLLLLGAGLFTASSVLAAFAPDPGTLIATRAVMGVAAAMVMPSTLTLVSTVFRDPRQQAVAISVWMSCVMGGSVLGPLAGGLLLQHFWWGSVFLLAVPIMGVLLLTGPSLLPEARDAEPGKVDVASVALSLLAILPAIYGLKALTRDGWHPVPVAAVLIGVTFGIAFVARQRRLAHPLLDVRLFANRTFTASLSMMFFGAIFLAGSTFLVSQFLQVVLALEPLESGLWLAPAALAMIGGSLLAPHLARRIRPAYVMAGGLAVGACGYLLLTQVGDTGDLTTLVIGWTVALGGSGLPAGLAVGMMIGSVPPEKTGSASALQQTGIEFGLALGIALVGSVATAVYREHLDGTMPTGIPGAVADAARDSVTGALDAAQRFPEILNPARAAYTSGLTTAVTLSAIATTCLAVFLAVSLRHVHKS